jgi:hypothetical protein
MRHALPAIAACLTLLLTPRAHAENGSVPVFETDIRPILRHRCVHCHGEDGIRKGDLDVRLRRLLTEPHGAENSVAVVPGKPHESELVRLIREGDMPRKGKPVPEAEIQLIERWIAAGAPTARPEPAQVPDGFIAEEDRAFWSFQPLSRTTPPTPQSLSRTANPIDQFIVDRLERANLAPNPEAPKNTLIRRVALDLIGLPPTPEEINVFLSDTAPDAYARMVDRYLASPRFGEHWGRHWLDLAGYADSDGYSDADPIRPWAYHYRDYVIRSLNADKPLDRFIKEQLAGDEMVGQNLTNLGANPERTEKLVATGFLRMVPDGTATAPTADQQTAREAVISETLKVVSGGLLGLTLGCAQCHDHKHDPILQSDYYAFRAIFEPGFNTAAWRTPAARLLPLMTDAERTRAAEIEQRAKDVEAKRKLKEDEFIANVLEWELEKKPEPLREPLRAAYRTAAKSRTPAQTSLLKQHPTINQLSPGSLYLYDRTYKTKHEAELKVFTEEIAKIRKEKPPEIFIPVFNETATAAKTPPETAVHRRGDPNQRGRKVDPAELTVLGAKTIAGPAAPSEPTSSTGRRTAYAEHLTSGQHPLLSRVLANRIWHHLFGRGIVATPGDFGKHGDRPSHPELLDWLATELSQNHWSLKHLQRLILNSATYRQTTTHSAEADAADPENRLLARQNLRRINAETLRDAILHTAGNLNPKMFGAPVPVMIDVDGQIVVGIDTTDTAGRPTGKVIPLNGEEFRRSIYLQSRRSRPVGMLETFDLPRMEPNCEIRSASTVAPQSLSLMNNDFVLNQSAILTERIVRESGADPAARVRTAWKITLNRDPSSEELTNTLRFLSDQSKALAQPATETPKTTGARALNVPQDPDARALATLCQALMSSNAFLYID